MQTQQSVLEIDLQALTHNYKFITATLSEETKVMAVVKAFGYGSDAIAVARKLIDLGVSYVAVAYADEGIALRKAGITLPILVLHTLPIHCERIIDACLEPAIYSSDILAHFHTVAQKKKQTDYPVHIKFNTGLNRLGFGKEELPYLQEKLPRMNALKVASLFSHLVASEDPSEAAFTQHQIKQFKELADGVEKILPHRPWRHQSNTSAIFNYPEAHFDMVRTGIGLYGYGNSDALNQKLRPVATLKTVITQIHEVAAGETVGYNRAYTAAGPERIATLALGHADGISRAYGNGVGQFLIQGTPAPIVGNVCMDMLMVNVTNIDCKAGDEAIFFGSEQPAATLSKRAHTIPYELLTAISQRVTRVIVNA
ncbi:alanine racemase [Altibacter sp. HG106]|uniref:alanine racemase n=1 Tax=Altibacter sp. HG106 TaxID=3023937 RepID=UPI00235055A9|nr:alanine racemase [Altibacter sp. HG106]MDC7994933.1 alanine racemase [Altibacter sp. HG106]